MLDHYHIKLPDLIRSRWMAPFCFYRKDVPKREALRYSYLCQLYRYELIGYIDHKYFLDCDKILTNSLEEFEEQSDNSKYRRYLDYLGIDLDYRSVEYNA